MGVSAPQPSASKGKSQEVSHRRFWPAKMGLPDVTDGDYSSWESVLRKRVDNACNAYEFSAPKSHYGRSIWKSMASAASVVKLERWRTDEGYSIQKYIRSRGACIAVIVLGLIMLVFAIVSCFAVKTSVREKMSKWFCGLWRRRNRPRLQSLKKREKRRLGLYAALFGLASLVSVIYVFIVSAQLIDGAQKANCNVWLQMYGHFFGAGELSKGGVDEIAMSWTGTVPLHTNVLKLGEKVAVGPDNPTRALLQEGYLALQADATARADKLSADVLGLKDITTNYRALMTMEYHSPIPGEELNQRLVGLGETVMSKSDIFVEDLAKTLTDGWTGIEELLERYTGDASELMNKSYAAVVDTVRSLTQIDAAIAKLAKLWDHQGKTVTRLLVALGSISIVVGVALVAALILSCFLFVDFFTRSKKDRLPAKKEIRPYGAAFSLYCVVAGLSAFLCGLFYLLGAVGTDVCALLNDGLFQRGNWDILGDAMIEDPVKDFPVADRVDLRTVFDTCIKRTGEGNVAVSIGLDGKIAELANDVNEARRDVLETRDRLLKKREKMGRVSVLGLALNEAMEVVTRRYEAQSDGELTPFFEEVRNLNAEVKPWKDVGETNLLWVIPMLTMQPVLFLVLELVDPMLKVNALNAGYDIMNEALTYIHKNAETPNAAIPTKICPGLLNNRALLIENGTSFDCDGAFLVNRDWTTTTRTTTMEKGSRGKGSRGKGSQAVVVNNFDRYQDLLDNLWNHTIWPDAPLFRGKYEGTTVPQRTAALLKEFIRIAEWNGKMRSDYATLQPDQFPCPDGAADCPFESIRQDMRKRFMQSSKGMVNGVEELLGTVDEYVDGLVLPTMTSLVTDANELTEDANCQFEGTALEYAVTPALCDATFPASASLCVIFGLISLFATALASINLFCFHYLRDLASPFEFNKELYNLANHEFTPMRSRKEFVNFTGQPTGAKGEGDLTARTQATRTTARGDDDSATATPLTAPTAFTSPLTATSFATRDDVESVILPEEAPGEASERRMSVIGRQRPSVQGRSQRDGRAQANVDEDELFESQRFSNFGDSRRGSVPRGSMPQVRERRESTKQ